MHYPGKASPVFHLRIPEPEVQSIERSSGSLDENGRRSLVLTDKYPPRASGDGMESQSDALESGNGELDTGRSTYTSRGEVPKNRKQSRKNTFKESKSSPSLINVALSSSMDKTYDSEDSSLIVQQESTPVIQRQPAPGISYSNHFDQVDVLEPKPINMSEYEYASSLLTSTVVERSAQLLDSQVIIKDLEQRNSRLIEEKSRLSSQLGVQTQVNSELKRLLVASVGEDIEERIERSVVDRVQSVSDVKDLLEKVEECKEELEQLSIECDVWRTKFLASRMMTDELAGWKATLYVKYRESQTALQKLLEEHRDIHLYLQHTNRLLRSCVESSLLQGESSLSGFLPGPVSDTSSCLSIAQDTHTLAEVLQELQGCRACPVTYKNEIGNQLQEMSALSNAEMLAQKVLSSDLAFHSEEVEEVNYMVNRLSKQYLGNSHKSRFLTNSYRITVNCCNRCKGQLQVV